MAYRMGTALTQQQLDNSSFMVIYGPYVTSTPIVECSWVGGSTKCIGVMSIRSWKRILLISARI